MAIQSAKEENRRKRQMDEAIKRSMNKRLKETQQDMVTSAKI